METSEKRPINVHGDAALQLLETFHLQDKAVQRFVFTMDVKSGASLQVWYWPKEDEIDANGLKTIFKEYEIVERTKPNE